jgi:hypothetical protein
MKTNLTSLKTLGCGVLILVVCAPRLFAADTDGPTITCSTAEPVECGTAVVTSATVQDTNGSPLTVEWRVNGTLSQTINLATNAALAPLTLSFTNTYPVGTNLSNVTVTDAATNQAACTTVVVVRDTQPPVIQRILATPSVLWPPNHKMRCVKVMVEAEDCSDFTWRITQITSNEPADGLGDGNTSVDWQIVRAHKALLRAERAGGGSGRIYTLTVEVTDASGNSTNGTVQVTVPHDMGHFSAPEWALWWTDTSGSLGMWRMNGANSSGASPLSPSRVDPSWRIVGTADLWDDGRTEILWQHASGIPAYWVMNGTNCVKAGPLNPSSVDSSWRIVGTGDLNDDGKTDILWQHTNGTPAYWLMDGTNCIRAGLFTPSSVDPSWRIVGTGDLNGDGTVQILWRHTSGTPGYWVLNGTTRTQAGLLSPSVVDPNWTIVGTEDVNGDGRTDIIWRHSSGSVSVWDMDGPTFSGGGPLNPGMVAPSWQVVGPK